jgi:hypothetical protein
VPEHTPEDFGLVGVLAKLAAFSKVAEAGEGFRVAATNLNILGVYSKRFKDTGLITGELLKSELHAYIGMRHLMIAQIATTSETEYGVDEMLAKELSELMSDVDKIIAKLEKEIASVEDH